LGERIDLWENMKLKSIWAKKEMVSKLKKAPTEREKNLCHLYVRQGNTEGAPKTPPKSMTQ
jgi:hypothetical protein